MKTWEESDGGDFSVRALKDITDDKELKLLPSDKNKYEFQKVDGEFKRFGHMKSRGEVPTSVDLECQKYQFESTEDKDIKYYVLHIIDTTDKELEPFIEKCLVQKEDEKHQTITKPDAVFKFMLASFTPAYEGTTVQLTNQEVQSHFKSRDCLVEAKAKSSPKEKKNSSSRTAKKKLTVNNDTKGQLISK